MEKAIEETKPTPTAMDPNQKILTVYTGLAEKHYDDLLKKYDGDLDTSQIFVSTSASLARLLSPHPLLLLC